MAILSKERYEEKFSGFFIRDCVLGFTSTRIGFLLVEELTEGQHIDDGWQTRFVAINLEQPMETRIFSMTGGRLSFATLSSAWSPNQEEYVMVDTGRQVSTYKPKEYRGDETEIPFDGQGYGYSDLGHVGCAVIKVVRVGTTVFAIGAPLRIFERLDNQQWREIKEIPIPAELKSKNDDEITTALGNSDFYDLAGYSTEDMYAVGGAGTVWHKKGEKWRQCPFPTNLRLHTVACGDDGLVYITDIRGSVWKGREDRWELVAKADMSLPFVDAVWFDNRLWCANDYGTWVLEDNALVPAHRAKARPMPTSSSIHAHRIDVSPDGKTMLVAGGHGASTYDGQRWEVLFDGGDF